jgi:hypothetical protein
MADILWLASINKFIRRRHDIDVELNADPDAEIDGLDDLDSLANW